MKLSQLIFTNCANENKFPNGYVVYGKTKDISDEDARFIQQVLDYKLRTQYQYNATPEVIDASFPRKLALFPLPSGKWCFGQSSYIGLDSGGNRYGNYMIHAYVFDKGTSVDPYLFYRDERFLLRLSKEEMMGPIKGELPQIELLNPDRKTGKLAIKGDETFKKMMAFLKRRSFKPQDKIYIRLKEEDYPILLGLISTHIVGEGEPISFMTYLNSKFDAKPSINLLFETEPLSPVTMTVMGNFQVYYFDLLEGMTNADVKVDSFYNTWLSLMLEDEEKALAFAKSIERIKAAYGIESNVGAYAVKFLVDGEFGRVGGALKAIEVYQTYLLTAKPEDIADKIYASLAPEEKKNPEYVNRIYAYLSATTKRQILQDYVRSVFVSASSVQSAYQALVNTPLGTYRDICDEIFAEPLLSELLDTSETVRLTLLVATKNASNGEAIALKIAPRVTDIRALLAIYDQYLADASYGDLARFIYKAVQKDSRSLNDFKNLYAYLGQADKEEVLQRYFGEVLSERLPYEAAIKAIKEGNPFEQGAYALSVFYKTTYRTLPSLGDYGKILAILMAEEGRVPVSEVVATYRSLQQKGKKQEDLVFDIIEKTKNSGAGIEIARIYLDENLDAYATDADIAHILDKLKNYPELQAETFLSICARPDFDLERAYAFASHRPNMRSPRIDVLRSIMSKREDPAAAKAVCDKNPDEPFTIAYMSRLYEKDKSDKLKATTGLEGCLKLVLHNELNAEEMEHCLSQIYGAPFKEFLKRVDEPRHSEIKAKARAKGVNLGRYEGCRAMDLLICIIRASKGRGDSLHACGFPKENIFEKYKVTITEDFASAAIRPVLDVLRLDPDYVIGMNTLLKPLANSETAQEKILGIEDQAFILRMIEYVRTYKNDNVLTPLLIRAIGKYVRKNSKDEKAIAKLLLRKDELELFAKASKKGELNPALAAAMVIAFPVGIAYLIGKSKKKKKRE